MMNQHLHYSKVLILLLWLNSSNISAEVVTDGTTGPATKLIGPNFVIGQDLGTQSGNNLFHSFHSFNLSTTGSISESAVFTGSNNIKNVISRVTGGNISTIDGLLKSEIANADFYFLNPAGIIFGENAKVNVPAAFHISTADELRLQDGSIFSASTPNQSTLGIAQPEAFGFLSPQSTNIIINGSQIDFSPDSAVSLSGNSIHISGANNEKSSLNAENGKIHITATGSQIADIAIMGSSDTKYSGSLTMDSSQIITSGAGTGGIKIHSGDTTLSNSQLINNNDSTIDAKDEINLNISNSQGNAGMTNAGFKFGGAINPG